MISVTSTAFLSFVIIFVSNFHVALQTLPPQISSLINQTRRILNGHNVGETRPYMVYLKLSSRSPSYYDNNWLCGGVIIHEKYILTSAACVEEAQQFYVISGTHRWGTNNWDDDCIKYGAKKAVWKCVPKNYIYDGQDFDNIRWMENDIAVVKVDEEFNFEKRIKGCEFIPKPIAYNNQSADLETHGATASIAGWGSTEKFGDIVQRESMNSPTLLEADVVLLAPKKCKSQWSNRYHHVIDNGMVCAKDFMDMETLSTVCSEQQVNCKELVQSEEFIEQTRRSFNNSIGEIMATNRRALSGGGFCENDHGGPLITGRGTNAVVIGIITASMTNSVNKKCHGPYLFTSVWKNRNLINCAINKEMGETCRRYMREGEDSEVIQSTYKWSDHSVGHEKKPSEIKFIKRVTKAVKKVIKK